MPDEVKLVERVTRAIREEQVRQYRDDERSKCPAGTAFYEEEVGPYKLALVAIEATRPTAATDDVVKELVEALRAIVGNANEAMPMGPFDCIDNHGEAYQSEAFSKALKLGRDLLATLSTDAGER